MKRILKYGTCNLKKDEMQIKKDEVQLKKLSMTAVWTGFEVCMITRRLVRNRQTLFVSKIHQYSTSHCVPNCISSTASLIPFAFIDGDRNYTLVCYVGHVLLAHSLTSMIPPSTYLFQLLRSYCHCFIRHKYAANPNNKQIIFTELLKCHTA